MAKNSCYVVWEGRTPGIYKSWLECSQQVDGYPNAKFEGFIAEESAKRAFRMGFEAHKASKSFKIDNKQPSFTPEQVRSHPAKWKVYPDGGHKKDSEESGAGLAVECDNVIVERYSGHYAHNGTNNVAEIQAAKEALLRVAALIEAGESKIVIFCDSEYVVNILNRWGLAWRKNGWKKKSSGAIKNLCLVKQLISIHDRVRGKVEISHVNSHIGIPGNEAADQMADDAILNKHVQFEKREV
ncbi:ribonuclease H family protein [Vibrio vulnificus]|nr:ribonuclease H family protein [Vibrio vulnificus]